MFNINCQMRNNYRYRLLLFAPIIIVVLMIPISCVSSELDDNNIVNAGIDSDRDGLSDEYELAIGTNPANPDTDSDGLLDGIEMSTGLDPTDFDTDKDGVAASDDSLPRINNNSFLIFIISVIIALTVSILLWIHIKYGFTISRKEVIANKRRKNDEEERTFQLVKDDIINLAKKKHGWLSASEVANELSLDIKFVMKCFDKLKAKQEEQLYRFPYIEKQYSKR